MTSGEVSPPDLADHLQGQLDQLALSCFNAILEVSKLAGPETDLTTATSNSTTAGDPSSSTIQARRLGHDIVKVMHEIDEAINHLPVLPESGKIESKVQELQAEYESCHRHLNDTVEEAGLVSREFRQTLSYISNKSG